MNRRETGSVKGSVLFWGGVTLAVLIAFSGIVKWVSEWLVHGLF